jgi:hypothetical protein
MLILDGVLFKEQFEIFSTLSGKSPSIIFHALCALLHLSAVTSTVPVPFGYVLSYKPIIVP